MECRIFRNGISNESRPSFEREDRLGFQEGAAGSLRVVIYVLINGDGPQVETSRPSLVPSPPLPSAGQR